jgi:FkbM family methyltransferase
MNSLVRAAVFQFRGRVLHQRTSARLGSSSRIWVDLHRTGGSKAVYANPPDHPEMLVWQQWLKPDDLFVDVGANVGTYTIWAGELGAEVIALEPAPDTCLLLKENVDLNGYNVEVIQAAAGSSQGTANFTSSRDCVNQFDPLGDTTVATVRLDDVIGNRIVKGMKIDVEGFEMEVLKGCSSALGAGRISLLQLEWNEASKVATGTDRAPLADFLGEFGYHLYHPSQIGELLPLDNVPSYRADVFAKRP